MSPVRSSVNEPSRPRRRCAALWPPVRSARRRRNRRCSGITASCRPAAMKPSRSAAWAKRSEPSPRDLRRAAVVVLDPGRAQAREVVGGALALAAARERDDGAVAGADVLLERRLGLLHRARADVRGLGAELERLVGGQRREPDAGARRRARPRSRAGADVEVVGVLVVERGADVLPVVGERRLDLLLGGDQDLGVRRRRGRAARGSGRPAAARRCRAARPRRRSPRSRPARGARARARRPARSRPRRGRRASAA